MLEKKRLLVVGGGVGIIVIFGLLGLFVFQKRQAAIISPIQGPGVIQEKELANPVTYKDEAGFEFDYPQNLTVKDTSGDDPAIYSSLEISADKLEGSMLIKIADTPYPSLEAWLKSKEASGAGNMREITLAGMPGRQIQFSNPRRLVTIIISDGVMYFFETPLDEKGAWNKIHNTVVSSFALSKTQAPAPAAGEEDVFEEEEVIE